MLVLAWCNADVPAGVRTIELRGVRNTTMGLRDAVTEKPRSGMGQSRIILDLKQSNHLA
jgi:hypothetical protein